MAAEKSEPMLVTLDDGVTLGDSMDSRDIVMSAYNPGYGSHGSYFPGGSLSDGSKWTGGLYPSGVSPMLDNYRLRQNARRAYHETPQARALIERYADTVVDKGLRLELSPKFKILGITEERALDWAQDGAERFDLWARSKGSSRDGTTNFYQQQRLVCTFQQRDGEYFPRWYFSKRRDLQNPLQIGFIDPNQIRGSSFTSTHGFQETTADDYDGIVRNKAGQEIAYKVWIRKNQRWDQVTIPAMGQKSKLRLMGHGFMGEYANQGRGYSRLSHALQEFSNLTDFTLAQIKKAINQSSIALFVKPSPDNPAGNPFEGNEASAIGGFGACSTVAASVCDDDDPCNSVWHERLDEVTLDEPGSTMVFGLNRGEDLKGFQDTSPSANFEKFTETFLSYLSASVGMPLEVLTMKFGTSYSAARAALILFWRVAQIWADEMAYDFLNITVENWLIGEIAAGRMSAPGFSDPVMRAAWLHCNWIGAPMPNIDPMRTAKADQLYAEMGAQDLDRVARNLNGSDGKANRARLTRQFEELPESPFKKSGPGQGG